MGIIIRNDDVNPNTNYKELMEMYDVIEKFVPDVEIWSVYCPTCVRRPDSNLIYPKEYYPLRQQPQAQLMKMVNHVSLPLEGGAYRKIVSHGIYHVIHKNMSRDLQGASIIAACRFLRTNIFVPPYSEYDETTIDICSKHGITFVMPSPEWKSLESEPFNPDHKKWFFHSWRYTVESLKGMFNAYAKI